MRSGLFDAAVAAANADAAEAVDERRDETRGDFDVTTTPTFELASIESASVEGGEEY